MPGRRSPAPTDPRPRTRSSVRLLANSRAAALAAVRVGPELVVRVREAALVARDAEAGVDALDELRRDLVEEARRLGRLVFAEDAAPGGAGQEQPLLRARHADVAEPALLLELVLALADRECGKRPSSRPAMITTGNSSPLAACIVISQTLASRVPGFFVGLGQQRQPIDEAAERRLPARGSRSRARPTRAPSGSRSARWLLRTVLVAQVVQVAGPVEHLADR